MEQALMALLLGDAGLSAHVAGRVHWLRRPGAVVGRPYLNLQVISGGDLYHSKGKADLNRCRVQGDFWGDSYDSVKQASRAFRALLSGYRGAVAGVTFQSILVESAKDFMGETAGAESQLFRVSVDILISWKEA